MILPEVVNLLTDVRIETTNNVPSRRQNDKTTTRRRDQIQLRLPSKRRRYAYNFRQHDVPDIIRRHWRPRRIIPLVTTNNCTLARRSNDNNLLYWI